MIRVFLLDDHEVVRHGLRELLEHDGDIEVVGDSGSAVEATHRIPALRPHVAVIDELPADYKKVSATQLAEQRLQIDPRNWQAVTDAMALVPAPGGTAAHPDAGDLPGARVVRDLQDRAHLDHRPAPRFLRVVADIYASAFTRTSLRTHRFLFESGRVSSIRTRSPTLAAFSSS